VPQYLIDLCMGVGAAAAYGLLGILLTLLGFKLFDLITPFSLSKELAEDENRAVAIVTGAVILGVALVASRAIG
jgi:uncharacterized membrane protein YjfL (UPF0719 family)